MDREGSRVLVRDLWEDFPAQAVRAGGVKEMVSRPRLGARGARKWGLQEVSFEVGAGEVVGLAGANGSGKTTLLRCVAGILPATRGEVLVRGRVVSVLELHLGFHPELTGRENALVAGSLMGVHRDEVLEALETARTFGELQGVIDHEVRTYSSGTRMRLALALGLELAPDVLLVDEYLAGADDTFRRRCGERVRALGEVGVTAIVASHDWALLDDACERCLVLDRGRLVADGPAAEVLDAHTGAAGAL